MLTSRFKFFPLWAAGSVTAIIAISLSWWDGENPLDSSLALIAAATGMMYTMFAGRGFLSCYVFGLINAPLYAYLSYRWGYYGDMALNLYYFVMMFPGIIYWRRNRADSSEDIGIIRAALSWRERLIWMVLLALAALLLWFILRAIGGNRPGCDALTNVLSIAAMILTVKRCIEQWLLWIAVDAIELVMWWRMGESSLAILAMWTLFLIDGLYLFSLWLRSAAKHSPHEVT